MLIITEAFAEGGNNVVNGGMSMNLVIMAAFVGLMYFIIIRPQSKKAKEHQRVLNSLQVKDEIVTIGGIYGVITKIEGNTLTLKVSQEGQLVLQKSAVAQLLPKGTLKL